jgi:hypothetical protein
MVSGVLGGPGHEGTGAGDLQAAGSHGTPPEAAPGPLRDGPVWGASSGRCAMPCRITGVVRRLHQSWLAPWWIGRTGRTTLLVVGAASK